MEPTLIPGRQRIEDDLLDLNVQPVVVRGQQSVRTLPLLEEGPDGFKIRGCATRGAQPVGGGSSAPGDKEADAAMIDLPE